ncbi:MAG: ABC transporter ATP-binding protein [Rhodobacteraceae bacterium]|nr:ABC transporter ATP-binding protein [Paracoccaceae bacterium]
MLQLKDLRSGYGKVSVLQGVNLHVNQGEIVGLLGKNGVGKSTTLKSIMGLLPTAGGSVEFEGLALNSIAAHKIPGQGIGYVPQGRGIFGALSVWENLCLGLPKDPTLEELDRSVFSRFPRLKERLKQAAGTLSGGEQQMLAIARCIAMSPKLILLDEPTEGVMPLLVKSIQDQVKSINQDGTAVLLVEQNVKAAARLCDRIYVMEKGLVAHELASSSFRENPDVLSELMGFSKTAA